MYTLDTKSHGWPQTDSSEMAKLMVPFNYINPTVGEPSRCMPAALIHDLEFCGWLLPPTINRHSTPPPPPSLLSVMGSKTVDALDKPSSATNTT